jgi:hypothetical protein
MLFDEIVDDGLCRSNTYPCDRKQDRFFCLEMPLELLIVERRDVLGLSFGIVRPKLEKCPRALLESKGKKKRFVMVTGQQDKAFVSFGHCGLKKEFPLSSY